MKLRIYFFALLWKVALLSLLLVITVFIVEQQFSLLYLIYVWIFVFLQFIGTALIVWLLAFLLRSLIAKPFWRNLAATALFFAGLAGAFFWVANGLQHSESVLRELIFPGLLCVLLIVAVGVKFIVLPVRSAPF